MGVPRQQPRGVQPAPLPPPLTTGRSQEDLAQSWVTGSGFQGCLVSFNAGKGGAFAPTLWCPC